MPARPVMSCASSIEHGWIDTSAVVPHSQPEPVRVVPEIDFDPHSWRVPEGVVQRFAGNAVDLVAQQRGERSRSAFDAHAEVGPFPCAGIGVQYCAEDVNRLHQIASQKSGGAHPLHRIATGTSSNRRLQWVTGFYYFREHATDLEPSVVAYEVFQGEANSSYNNFVQNRSPAAYGQATFELTDTLRLTTGGRLAVDKVDAQHEQLGYPDPVVQVPRVGHSASWTSFLPRVGLDYQWTPAVMAYVSIAEGSKSGGFNGRASSAEEFTQFEPEKVWAYEVGLRSEWFDKRMRVNATAFYSDYKDYQIQLNR